MGHVSYTNITYWFINEKWLQFSIIHWQFITNNRYRSRGYERATNWNITNLTNENGDTGFFLLRRVAKQPACRNFRRECRMRGRLIVGTQKTYKLEVVEIVRHLFCIVLDTHSRNNRNSDVESSTSRWAAHTLFRKKRIFGFNHDFLKTRKSDGAR